MKYVPAEVGEEKAAICRSGVCGHYDEKRDRCLLVVKIGRAKKQNRPGKIEHIKKNPRHACPDDPPQFGWTDLLAVDTMSDGEGSATH